MRIAAHLIAVAENVQWILALERLLNEIRQNVAHRQLDIAAHDVVLAERASFADADAIERANDGVGKLMLLEGAAREIFGRQFLKSVSAQRRRAAQLLALG